MASIISHLFPFSFPRKSVRMQDVRGRYVLCYSSPLLISVIAVIKSIRLPRRSRPRGKLPEENRIVQEARLERGQKSRNSEPRSSHLSLKDRRCPGSPLNSLSAPRYTRMLHITSHPKHRYLSVIDGARKGCLLATANHIAMRTLSLARTITELHVLGGVSQLPHTTTVRITTSNI